MTHMFELKVVTGEPHFMSPMENAKYSQLTKDYDKKARNVVPPLSNILYLINTLLNS